ncbi:hypothetical protein [Amycolatopsis jiangsuensis]|uniref:Secreted protein n=1 Tax=Amycolatopsis jiangsuensis TaxID=1181879 RepID=A0A840IW72_9PSEU|nr:hypothetical protein [Amycolatopsis jiangsuensis]MBB4686826.1 hypothetical protein [Amycolatopsis jiangsuensis]
MKVLRKVGTVGLLTAASAALVLSTAGHAGASGRKFTTYEQCVSYGNKLAQQGKLHNFYCSKNIEAGGSHIEYELHITG